MTDNSNAPRRSGHGDGAQHRATMNSRRDGNSVVPSAPGGDTRAAAGEPVWGGAGQKPAQRPRRRPAGHVGLPPVDPGIGGARALQHRRRRVATGHAGAGPAPAQQRRHVAGAAAEVHHARRARERDALEEVHGGPQPVVAPPEVLRGVPRGRLRHAPMSTPARTQHPMHSSMGRLYSKGMELRHLRYFVTVADAGNVSRSAVQLNITQPALSRQLRDLEGQLGLPLFYRVGRRLHLTAEGENLLERTREILRSADALRERAGALAGGRTGTLRLGATAQTLESLISAVLTGFRRAWPGIDVRLVQY